MWANRQHKAPGQFGQKGREGAAQTQKGPAGTLHLPQGAGGRPQRKGKQEAQARAFEDQPPPASTHPASLGDGTLTLYR